MTYYTESAIDVEKMPRRRGTVESYATMVFPSSSDGTFAWRISSPKIGQQLTLLSDVSLINYGTPAASLLLNAAVFNTVSIFQVFEYRNGDGLVQHRLVDISGASSTQNDAVLSQRFPLAMNNSVYATTLIGQGHSTAENTSTGRWLNEFYVTVTGNRGVADQLGIDIPNDGRVLLTTGAVTGTRDLAWGSGWLDTIKPPAPPSAEEIKADQALAKAESANQAKIDSISQKLETAKEKLQLMKERLASLSDEDAAETWLLAATAIDTAAQLAGLFTPKSVWAGKEAFEAIYKNIQTVGSAQQLASQMAELFKNPSAESFHETYQKFTGFLTNAVDYQSASSTLLTQLSVAASVYNFVSTAKNWNTNKDVIRSNISVTQAIIARIEDEIRVLQSLQHDTHGSTDVIREGNSVIIRGSNASSVFMFQKNDVLGATSNKTVKGADDLQQVTLGADGQGVVLKAGLTVVDGTLSSGDKVVIQGHSRDYDVDTRLDLIRVWKYDAQTDTIGDEIAHLQSVDGIQFNDIVLGNAGNNVLRSAGVGKISGMAGNDKLYGDGGNDTLEGGAGADLIDGGSGTDTASYAGAAKGVTVSLAKPSINTNDAKGDTFKAIENLLGSKYNDVFYGNTAANSLTGGAGDDKLYGDEGNDTLKAVPGLTSSTAVAARIPHPMPARQRALPSASPNRRSTQTTPRATPSRRSKTC